VNVADLLAELLTVEVELARLSARRDDMRAVLKAEGLRQADDSGAAPSWRVKGLGAVALVMPEPSRRVVDEPLFGSWVRCHYPEKLISVPNPTWTSDLLAKAVWDFCLVNPDTGEVIEGAAEVPRAPYLTVRLEKAAKDEAAAAS